MSGPITDGTAREPSGPHRRYRVVGWHSAPKGNAPLERGESGSRKEIMNNNSTVAIFSYIGHDVRTVTINGETWFVAADVLAILDLDRTALRRLDDDEMGVDSIHTPGGTQQFTIVSEAGLYSLILGSRKPEAKQFKRWITHVVLPEIRQTGSYSAAPALNEDQIVHQALTILAAKTEQLEAKIVEDAPKVDYVDTFVTDGDLRLLRAVAKDLNLSEQALRDNLITRKWIYKESATRWSERRQEKETVARYSPYADKAHYFQTTAVHDAPRFKGEVMHTLKVTPAGAAAIARNFGQAVRS